MKRILFLFFIALSLSSTVMAQGPWKLKLLCPEENVRLHIDLYEESVKVPGMEMFGPMNGYLGGNIYGVWTVTSFKIQDDKTATLRLSNDLGSETQKATLTQQSDSLYLLHLDGVNVVKRVVGKKLVKVPIDFKMKVDVR
ncbi:MAG: hypothetical protein J6P55_02560 [Bacteroidaceae bacterium]|nr:hypothetical protein [Bacteroidaceae bacterium]